MPLTFRPSPGASIEIEKIKTEVGLRTTSKVLDYVLDNFLLMEKELRDAEKEIELLNSELSGIKDIIKIKSEADKNFNDLVSKFKDPDAARGG